jgi:hypothetical protein
LPDVSWYKIPKMKKFTPNCQKISRISIKIRQNFPLQGLQKYSKFGIFCMQIYICTVWQPCSTATKITFLQSVLGRFRAALFSWLCKIEYKYIFGSSSAPVRPDWANFRRQR